MSCGEIINLITAIGTVATAIVALLIAVFQDRMRTWFTRPTLEISIGLCPPDCHKTRFHPLAMQGREASSTVPSARTTTLYPYRECAADITPTRSSSALADASSFTSSSRPAFTGDHGRWPAPSRIADVYYFRLKVHNKGKSKAESVEVFAAKLERRRADGTFREVDTFLPMNLLWSHYRQVFLPAISPKTYKHCDLAHIIDPKEREGFPEEHKTWANVSTEKTVLSFDTVVQPYTQSYLVPGGTYLLDIVVAAANAEPVEKRLEITLAGDWYDDEREMLSQGIGIRIL